MALKKEAEEFDKHENAADARIGEFLVRANAISPKQAREILKKQGQKPEKLFGEIALEKGFIYDEVTKKYLESRGFF